jgi:glycerol-3-phosphate dehydrogenase
MVNFGMSQPSPEASSATPIHDLLVIGAGINGAGIARDAAGRGLSVILCDQGDIGGATSSASSKLIHGGLRYLEHGDFRLVAESLAEREVLLNIAPHLTRPLRFIMPHSEALRPAWMIRFGLMLYDTLGRVHRRVTLPGAETIDLALDSRGAPLHPRFTRGFAYSDVAADDARLTLANARSAAIAGATVLPRTRFTGAVRGSNTWLATLEDRAATRRDVRVRAIVNAAGPWVARVLGNLPASFGRNSVRLVRGSHIVVPRLYPGEHAYTLQNDDGRVCFLIPFETKFTLIGTTEVVVGNPNEPPQINADEIDYLCRAVSRYLRSPVQQADVVWSYAGIRALVDDGRADASSVSREYAFVLDPGKDGTLPVLTVFGGKLTTYRTLGEAALSQLKRWFPHMGRPWTDRRALPGGNLGGAKWAEFVAALCAHHPLLPPNWLRGLAHRHGSEADLILAGVRDVSDLGRDFGGGLFECEVEHCIAEEWARSTEDFLWRRTKCGLHMLPEERVAFAEWLTLRSLP